MKDAIMSRLNKSCKDKDFNNVLAICREYGLPYMGMFTSTVIRRQSIHKDDDIVKYHDYFTSIINKGSDNRYRVKLLCNWTEDLRALWNRMQPENSKILLVDDTPDFWVIINSPPPGSFFNPSKTIVFQMEPLMQERPEVWGEWADPNPSIFLRVFTHKTDYNNVEWHLSSVRDVWKDDGDVVSAILSDKYYDQGHIWRIDFVKYIENIVPIDVFGSNLFRYKSFKGPLPPYEKDKGLYPYKYHFNAENHSIPNYFTEKIVDAILAECLCFYWGCPNIADYIDSRAYIVLDLNNFDESLRIVKEAIENDEWSNRIDIIRSEKKRILDEMNFFTRITAVIEDKINT